jgi:hypothetical protein
MGQSLQFAVQSSQQGGRPPADSKSKRTAKAAGDIEADETQPGNQ